jgi:antitoxin (DNA-binding transcriptional repressor) of toxin-antitoxin stability system
MKVIDVNEAKTHLERYALDCQESPVIVTIDGKPTFEMIPIASDDPEFIDRLLEQDQGFRRLAEARRREADEGRVSTLEDVQRRLESESQRPG